MTTTEHIRQRFAKAHRHYAKHASVQHIIAKQLIDYSLLYLPKKDLENFHRILEIGCGIGNLTQIVLSCHPTITQLYLNDLYDDIKNHNFYSYQGKLDYLIGDINDININQFYHYFNGIISSSTLQWIYPLDNLLTKLYHILDDEGYLIFSSFLDNNLYQIRQLTGEGLNYYSLNRLLNTLNQTRFSVKFYQQISYTLTFDQPHDILKHLQYTGVNATNKNFVWTKQKLLKFYSDYQQFSQKKSNKICYPLTYDTVYIIAKKDKNL